MRTVLKILIASAIAFVIGDAFSVLWDKIVGYSLVLGIIKIFIVMVLTLAVYLITSFVLRIEYLKDLKDRIEAKWKKA